MKKIFKWIKKIIPKNLLPSSGLISFGMTNFERYDSPGGTTVTEANKNTTPGSFQVQSNTFGVNAVLDPDGGGPGASNTSRNNMLSAPYGLGEFYEWKYSSCLLVGTKILMFDGTEKNIEDLEIDDEVYSPILPGLEKNYHDYTLDSVDNIKFDKGKVKRVVFDFITEYYSINKKYNATSTHAVLAWKDKDKRFEWWQIKDIEVGDKVVNPKLELEEVKTIKKIEKELEVVSIGLRKYNVFFADGYMNHD
jgi:hypothetical protein